MDAGSGNRKPSRYRCNQRGHAPVYCNTPEHYRLAAAAGVSDKHESCMHAYRSGRGDPPIEITFNGLKLEGLVDATLHGTAKKDMWLHCWVGIEIPPDEASLKGLISDLNRIRGEFGSEYAVMPHFNIKPFTQRLRTLSALEVVRGPLRYSKERSDWSVACKSEHLAYQREYRFALGACTASAKRCGFMIQKVSAILFTRTTASA